MKASQIAFEERRTKVIEYGVHSINTHYRTNLRDIIPNIDSPRFLSFAAASVHLLAPTLRKTNVKYNIDDKSPTAYMSFDPTQISLPAIAYTREFYKQHNVDGELGKIALASLIGFQIHEGAHVKFTPRTLMSYLDKINPERFPKLAALTPRARRYYINVFEDFRINRKVGALATNGTLFLNTIQAVFSDFSHIEKALDMEEKSLNRLASLMLMLSSSAVYGEGFLEGLFGETLCETIHGATNVADDLWAILKGAESLLDEVDITLSEPEEERSDEKNETVKDLIDEKLGEILESLEAGELEAIAAEVSSGIESSNPELNIKVFEKYKPEGIKRTFEAVLDTTPITHVPKQELEPQEGNYNFIRKLELLQTDRTAPGEIAKSGQVLVKNRIARIATDGKMFARRTMHLRVKAKTEIIILLDLSGSMGSIIQRVLSGLYAIIIALKSTAISFKVYYHTDKHYSGISEPYVRLIGTTKTSSWDKVLASVGTHYRGENYDGIAIKTVGDLFDTNSDIRLLFSLSDGRPAGDRYWGDSADDHTRDCIENLRKQGVEVYSLSLTNGVLRSNDDIYGKAFNMNATTAHKMETELMSKLISRMQGGDA